MEKVGLSLDKKIVETKKRKAREISIVEAGAFSVSDGFGLRNIAPYAIALNASNSMIGFLTSIPSLLGNISQLITAKLLERYSRKKVVIFSVFLQTFFWLTLILPGILFLRSTSNSNIPVILLLAIYTALIVSGSLAGPAWNSWMKDIVPEKELGRYFARRNRIAGFITFFCMMLAGFILNHFKRIEVLYGFFILLFFSFLFRGISGYLFTKKYEPRFKENKKTYFSLKNFVDNMPFNNFGRFVLFLSLLNFSVAIASPFFAVYLLRNQVFKEDYVIYMTLTMIMPIVSILSMNYWGKVSDSLGNVKIFKITGVLIILIPFVYFLSSFSNDIGKIILILIPIEILAGIGWSGFNLSASNFVLKSVSRDKMVLCSSYMNVLNGFSIFLGATIGGFIASFQFWNPILLVFLISGFGRILIYFLVLPKIKEKVHEKSRYDRKNFIGSVSFFPRFVHNIGEIIYFKKTFNSLKKSRFFNFI